ncbi:MerR family transcriptional regulator [Streptomyces sp. OUCMDZ-4982]|uniref:MerR family transcriptional regulator n=1 Tax=Streptomyces sp. OUCMDZ-4982 TaxID=2973090 RepID=UPI00215CD855|nr:MerR family transcriptional regulator [Streptomyces sp. OUCMDZ-4982]MCR8947149.1 MerR family transcriptional regulator [Streptomyces sp. OUCMDZ-4982]
MDTDLLTTTQAAAHAHRARQLLSAGAAAIRPTTIRDWASRGHLPRAGLTENGRPLYHLADVARAELATRARALRLVGIPEQRP